MIRKRVEIDGLEARDVERLIRLAVSEAMEPVKAAMDELNDKLRKSRQVITHKEAPAYFNYDVSPETIIRYIKHEGLPATQKGRLYFISLPELFRLAAGGG